MHPNLGIHTSEMPSTCRRKSGTYLTAAPASTCVLRKRCMLQHTGHFTAKGHSRARCFTPRRRLLSHQAAPPVHAAFLPEIWRGRERRRRINAANDEDSLLYALSLLETTHAPMASVPPTTMLSPTLSPRSAHATAAAKSGSAANMSDVFEEDSFVTTMVCATSTKAEEKTPIPTSPRNWGMCAEQYASPAEHMPPHCAMGARPEDAAPRRPHATEQTDTTATWRAVISMAFPGFTRITSSVRKRKMPKRMGCDSPMRSPAVGSAPPPRQRHAVPAVASAAAIHDRAVRRTPDRASRKGQTTQLKEAKKEATPALVPPARHTACARFPIVSHAPVSSPATMSFFENSIHGSRNRDATINRPARMVVLSNAPATNFTRGNVIPVRATTTTRRAVA
mmetsp:Transcript_16057/g.32109  ORF Transcript_16057/g.32109 Transcript_16057/m.32109 type:complete len:394 (-) Transcript_16057:542-1723(-)